MEKLYSSVDEQKSADEASHNCAIHNNQTPRGNAMDRLQSMRVFQQVVDEGNFAAAARKLDLTPAAVTRLVVDLEKHLGVRLLQRTTRRLALTPAGEVYLSRLRHILSDIDEADAIAAAQSHEMRGTVRILSTPVIATHIIAAAIPAFQTLYPAIELDLHVQDVVDANIEDHDLTFVTDMVPMVSTAVGRTIVTGQSVFCASPEYLARHGEPTHPEDLRAHRFLRLRPTGTRPRPLQVIDPTDGDRKLEVDVPSTVSANHTDVLLRAAIAGGGICSQSAALIAPILKSGYLKRVLAPWITTRISLVAAMPTRKYMPARTRAFLEYMVEHTRESLAGLDMSTQDG